MSEEDHRGRSRLIHRLSQLRGLRHVRSRREKNKDCVEKAYEALPGEGFPPKRQREDSDIKSVEEAPGVSIRKGSPSKRQCQADALIANTVAFLQDTLDSADQKLLERPLQHSDVSEVRLETKQAKYRSHGTRILLDRLHEDPLELNAGRSCMLDQGSNRDATLKPTESYRDFLEQEPIRFPGDAFLCATWFISSRGNEYFCEIDEEYLTDRFNLTGLNTEVQYYQYALDLVTDVFDLDCEDDMREQIEKSARHLYGLVHARYIVTTRGLAKMVDKYKKADFGKCPRVLCDSHPLLPMGLSDVATSKSVKLFCAKCEDIYNPKSSRHAAIDGAYFGSSFHNILFQVYPALIPEKSRKRHEPKIYGFKVHAAAALARWQDGERRVTKKRLAMPKGECNAVDGVGVGYIEDREGRGTDSEIDEDDVDEGEDELGLAREAEVQGVR